MARDFDATSSWWKQQLDNILEQPGITVQTQAGTGTATPQTLVLGGTPSAGTYPRVFIRDTNDEVFELSRLASLTGKVNAFSFATATITFGTDRAAKNISSVAAAGTYAQFTTATAHGFVKGEYVTIAGFSGGNSGYNGRFKVTGVSSTTVFTCSAITYVATGTGTATGTDGYNPASTDLIIAACLLPSEETGGNLAEIEAAISITRKMGNKTSQANRTAAVTTSGGGAAINCYLEGHGYTNGQYVSISGSGNAGVDHDGTWAITYVDVDNFTIADAYVSDQNVSVTDGSLSITEADQAVPTDHEAMIIWFRCPTNTRFQGTLTWYEGVGESTTKHIDYVCISSGPFPTRIKTPYWTLSGKLIGASAFGDEILQPAGVVEYIINYDKSYPSPDALRGEYTLIVNVVQNIAATVTRVITPYFPLRSLRKWGPLGCEFYTQMEDATAGTDPQLQHRPLPLTDARANSTITIDHDQATDGSDLVGTTRAPVAFKWDATYVTIYNQHATKYVDAAYVKYTW